MSRGRQPAAGRNPLSGRVVVITGAARGLGARLARTLAGRGARLALLGLEPAELAQVAAECGPEASWWEVDVTDEAALTAAAAEVLARYGRVDVVVANAGIAVGGPFLAADPGFFTRVIEVNLLGSVATARAFLPALLASRGYLLQIASLAAMSPAPMMAAYCASKAGVEAFAHSLRAEVAHHGVAVGVAYLSWTDTDLVRGADATPALADMRARLPFPFSRTYPLAPAAQVLADGIARRAPHVYGQRWVRGVQLLRGGLPALVGRFGPRDVAAVESRLRDEGPADTRPVGPGGAADTAAARSR